MPKKTIGFLQAVFVIVAVSLLAGCGGGGGSTPAPFISDATVTPPQWSSGGGTATIKATVTDSSTLSSVTATVTLPSGSKSVVTLSEPSGLTYYTGQFYVPANSVVGGSSETYSVVISATDTAGKTSFSQVIEFSVPAPTEPPSPPLSE